MKNGYSLIKKMHRIRNWYQLSATEQVLFHELINVCNAKGWKEIFCSTNTALYQSLNISENTFIKARDTLIKIGLISYQQGKNKRKPGYYSLWTELPTGAPLVEFLDDFADEMELVTLEPVDKEEKNKPVTEANTEANTEVIPEANPAENASPAADYYKTQTQTHKKTNKKGAGEKERVKEKFENFRREYPGNKRGADTEFDNFRKKYPDHSELVDELLPALNRLKQWRHERRINGEFVPHYPNLSTWINQRRWETELEISNDQTDENYPIVVP